MIETLVEMSPQHRASPAKLGAQILARIGALRSMEEQAKALDAACDTYLLSLPPGPDGLRVINPEDFQTPEDYYRTLARLGRPKHDDRFEIDDTSKELGDDIAALHERSPVFAKTRSDTPGGEPKYTLGIVTATQAVVIPDPPVAELVALRLETSSVRHGKDYTLIRIGDLAAQRRPHANTGDDTPFVIAGQEKVKDHVEFTYRNPMHPRSASGKDSRDTSWAMVASGITPEELGFMRDEISKYKAQMKSGIQDVCMYGAPYRNYVPMLAPLCGSLAEVHHIITSAQCSTVLRDPHDDLTRDYQQLCDLYAT